MMTLPDGPTNASGALFFDGAERVLLVEPTYKAGFEFPGGGTEGYESPYETCVREVDEELALAMPGPPRLLVTDWVAPASGIRGGIRWLFDGGRLTDEQIGAIRLPADELRSFVFVTEIEAAALLPPRRTRRLAGALAARRAGHPAYLEDGRELPAH